MQMWQCQLGLPRRVQQPLVQRKESESNIRASCPVQKGQSSSKEDCNGEASTGSGSRRGSFEKTQSQSETETCEEEKAGRGSSPGTRLERGVVGAAWVPRQPGEELATGHHRPLRCGTKAPAPQQQPQRRRPDVVASSAIGARGKRSGRPILSDYSGCMTRAGASWCCRRPPRSPQ